MISDFVTHWLFLAIVSAIATAILIVLSWGAFGGIHSSLIMALRVIGVVLFVAPVVVIVSIKGTTGLTTQAFSKSNIILWLAIAISAGISWYSFYLALDYGKIAGASIALITSINYSSAGLILLITYALGWRGFDIRNCIGIVLLLAGLYLVGLEAPRGGPTSEASADSAK